MERRTTKADSRKTATAKKDQPRHIGIVQKDPYLEPYEDAIRGRHEHAEWKKNQLTNNGKKTLAAFASGHDYYGLHKMKRGWVFREWAPNATDIYLVGDFNNWTEDERYRARRIEGTGNWELKLSEKAMKHGDLYKMHVYWRECVYGHKEWCRTKKPRYSRHRCGPPNLMCGRKTNSPHANRRYSYTNATSEWHRTPKRWAHTRNSETTCCPEYRKTDTTAFR